MTIDISARILWLSDIHYDKEYKNKNETFQNYISSFIQFCKSLKDIDYILLSGDIAQSGIKEDSNDILNIFKISVTFLSPLQTKMPSVLLTIFSFHYKPIIISWHLCSIVDSIPTLT